MGRSRTHSGGAAIAAAALLLFGAASARADTQFGGNVGSRLQLEIRDCREAGDCRLLNFRNASRLGLWVDGQPSAKTRARARIDLRGSFFGDVDTLDAAGDPQRVRPVSLRVEEAFVDGYDIVVDGLELRVGAQRIAWGTADGVSPLDRLNPLDLEDPTRWDRRLGTLAIKLAYETGGWRFEAVTLPLFTPALLAIEELDLIARLDPSDVIELDTGGAELRRVETRSDFPDPALRNFQYGLRGSYSGELGDFSLSWYNGRDSLPQVHGTLRLTGFGSGDLVDIGVPLRYPRLQVIGADWRGPLFAGLTGWVEIATVLPVQNVVSADRNQLESLERLGIVDAVPDPLPRQQTQDDAPYVQAIAGFDVTLPHRVYLNIQYLHGFPTERQRSEQHDYLLIGSRIPLAGEWLALNLRIIGEWGGGDTLGYSAGGDLELLHDDNLRLSLGAIYMGGQQGATLQRFDDLSNLRVSAALTF